MCAAQINYGNLRERQKSSETLPSYLTSQGSLVREFLNWVAYSSEGNSDTNLALFVRKN